LQRSFRARKTMTLVALLSASMIDLPRIQHPDRTRERLILLLQRRKLVLERRGLQRLEELGNLRERLFGVSAFRALERLVGILDCVESFELLRCQPLVKDAV